MQAHANDLRAEAEKDWGAITGDSTGRPPTAAALDAFVHRAASDWRACSLHPGVAALLDYAEEVTRSPASVTEADLAALRPAGWSDSAIHDATQVVAYFNYINRIADALGVEPERDLPIWGGAGPGSSDAAAR